MSISCREALALVHEYLDGELDAASRADVARHFSLCEGCYPHLLLEERFRAVLHRFGGAELCPERLKQRIYEALTVEGRGPHSS